jgi:acyl-CoA synthetase (NDP forming)
MPTTFADTAGLNQVARELASIMPAHADTAGVLDLWDTVEDEAPAWTSEELRVVRGYLNVLAFLLLVHLALEHPKAAAVMLSTFALWQAAVLAVGHAMRPLEP